MLERQQPIPPAVLLRLAKDPDYRADLYDAMYKQHKTALFPVAYRTAVALGQSAVYTSANYEEEETAVDTVTFFSKGRLSIRVSPMSSTCIR